MGTGLEEINKFKIRKKFRWSMEIISINKDESITTLLSEISINKISFDYRNKTISFKAYDIITDNENFSAFVWALKAARNMYEDPILKFCTYDGCGVCLDVSYFSDLTLLEHKSDFDYSVNEISEQEIKISYGSMSLNLKDEIIIADKGCTEYKIAFFDGENKTHEETVDYFNKPSFDMKEISFPRLNGEFLFPGKVKWEPVTIYKKGRMKNYLTGHKLYCGELHKLELSIKEQDVEEKFLLSGVVVNRLVAGPNSSKMEIIFSHCKYNRVDLNQGPL